MATWLAFANAHQCVSLATQQSIHHLWVVVCWIDWLWMIMKYHIWWHTLHGYFLPQNDLENSHILQVHFHKLIYSLHYWKLNIFHEYSLMKWRCILYICVSFKLSAVLFISDMSEWDKKSTAFMSAYNSNLESKQNFAVTERSFHSFYDSWV